MHDHAPVAGKHSAQRRLRAVERELLLEHSAQISRSDSQPYAREIDRPQDLHHRGGWQGLVPRRVVPPLRPEEVLPIYAIMNELGRNTLLWMLPSDAARATSKSAALRRWLSGTRPAGFRSAAEVGGAASAYRR